MSTPPESSDSLLSRQERSIAARAEQRILERVRPYVTAEVIEEHRHNPLGEHSLPLDFVLGYLRRHGNEDMHRLLIVATTPEREFHVAEHPTLTPGVRMDVRADGFESVEEATHRIFLERLTSVGLLPVDGGDK